MPKVLGQAGISLPDAYDISGSKGSGVDSIQTEEVSTVHEMGATMFSERLQSFFVRMTTGDLLQDITFNIEAGGIPDSPNRLLGVTMFADEAARVTRAALGLRNTVTSRIMPLLIWDTADDAETPFVWNNDGAGLATFHQFRPTLYTLPTMVVRAGDEKVMPDFVFSGLTAGFGAGNVEVFAMLHLARANPGNPPPGAPSSHGLPLPGW